MATDQSGLRWPAWPTVGAVGAGRRDELPADPAGFSLTPSGEAERQAAQATEAPDEEVPDAGPEQPG